MQFINICNPENRRAKLFKQAALDAGLPEPIELAYEKLLREEIFIEDYLGQNACFRIDSPGENLEVNRHFLRLGAGHSELDGAAQLSPTVAMKLPLDKGRVWLMKQEFLGFKHFLKSLDNAGINEEMIMNKTSAILTMFDKSECHQLLQEKEVSVPEGRYEIRSYSELRETMQQEGWKRVFVKPLHGSSASGVLAYRMQDDKETMYTSVEIQGERVMRLYNSLKIRQYSESSTIRTIIDYLGAEGLHVERWIPKDEFQGKVYDLRVMVIQWKARQVVMRQSNSPMTNLHLGNQRGDLEAYKKTLEPGVWENILAEAEKAVRAIPGTGYAGVDLLLPTGSTKPYILEVNAFGDLLPKVIDQGETTYESIVNLFS